MSYEIIDPKIYPWARKNTLYLYTQYKDDEVRLIHLVSVKGELFGIYFYPPLGTSVKIRASNHKKKKEHICKEWVTDITHLESVLEEVLQAVKSWM